MFNWVLSFVLARLGSVALQQSDRVRVAVIGALSSWIAGLTTTAISWPLIIKINALCGGCISQDQIGTLAAKASLWLGGLVTMGVKALTGLLIHSIGQRDVAEKPAYVPPPPPPDLDAPIPDLPPLPMVAEH